jgi:hypothetical protein
MISANERRRAGGVAYGAPGRGRLDPDDAGDARGDEPRGSEVVRTRARHGHHAVRDLDEHVVVRAELGDEGGPQVAHDVLVLARQDLQQVRAADDADHGAAVDDRQAADAGAAHEPGSVVEVAVRQQHLHVLGHDVGDARRRRTTVVTDREQVRDRVRTEAAAQQVDLADDADQRPVLVHDRGRSHVAIAQQPGGCLDRRVRGHRHRGRRHDVRDEHRAPPSP